ncbi:MAG: hypothetical protein LBP59_19405 [Planctomycetaceae bacterium]|jgi:hypothetical protein|nr:hypothetical protein [Planctomycetaceae bacterium]
MREFRDIDEGTIRRIDWQELLPPVLFFRLFNVSLGVRVLFFAFIGIFLTIGVNLFLYPFNPPPLKRFEDITGKSIARERGLSMLIDRVNNRNVKIGGGIDRSNFSVESEIKSGEFAVGNVTNNDKTKNKNTSKNNIDDKNKGIVSAINFDVEVVDGVLWLFDFSVREACDSVLFVWLFFTYSGGQFFTLGHNSWSSFGFGLLGFAATVIIWGFSGGLICRSVAMRLTQDKSETVRDIFRFLYNRGFGFLSSVLILTVGILFCLFAALAPVWVAGYLGVGAVRFFVTIIFPFIFLFNFFALVLLFGLWFGFPLLYSAVAVEGADGFDAVSRAFSYLFQRLFHYVFYWFLAAVQGFLGYLVVMFFVMGTIMLTEHFAGLDGGVSLFGGNNAFVNSSSGVVDSGVSCNLDAGKFCVTNNSVQFILLAAWFDLLRFLVIAYIFAWFWSSGVVIYLLLRRSVDAAPFTEIYCQEPLKIRVLQKIKKDEKGAPEFSEEKNTETANRNA